MDNLKVVQLHKLLRKRANWFLNHQTHWFNRFFDILHKTNKTTSVYLFGGVLRDLAIYGYSANPADIDLVVDGTSLGQLETVFRPFIQSSNRFGGLRLAIDNTSIDIWPLNQTWAFRSQSSWAPTITNLPSTTFLNIEAVAAEMLPTGIIGNIYSQGFFEGILQKTIEVNYHANPFPERAVHKSLKLSTKLNFSVGPGLAQHANCVLNNSSCNDRFNLYGDYRCKHSKILKRHDIINHYAYFPCRFSRKDG